MNWTNDAQVTKFLRWAPHDDIAVTRQVIGEWVSNYRRPDFYQWAIVLKEIDEPIGSLSVVKLDEKTQKAHIGYCIGSKWWNRKITTEAFETVIAFLFEKVGVKRIEVQHDPDNPSSGKVMEKCGLIYEGTLRKANWSNRGIVDVAIYSLLSKEYQKKI